MVEQQKTAGEGRGRRSARAWAAAVSLAGIAGVSAGSAAVAAPTDLRVVLRAADPRGASLAPVARREVEAVLLERAGEAGVVICHDGAASPGPPVFAGICAAPGPEVTPFWWDLRLDLPRSSGITIATASLQLALSAGPPQKGAPEIFLLGPFAVPAGLPAPDLEAAALRPVLTALRSSPPLLAWLRGLAARPGLLRVRALTVEAPKAGTAAMAPGKPMPVAPAPPVPAPPAPDEAGAWNAEVLQITDLLIDGDPRAALERADRLLREPRLPADLAARTRELQAKAAAKVEQALPTPRSAPAAPTPPTTPTAPKPAAPAPAPQAPSAPAAASGAPAGKESREAVFPARQAAVGQGFGAGPDGQLRVTREGIAFHRAGSAAADWSVRWPDLISASRDEGLWESPFPLVLVERGGRKRYVSVTDGHGRYVSGEPLLAAIASGQRAFRRSHDEGAGGRSTGTEGGHP